MNVGSGRRTEPNQYFFTVTRKLALVRYANANVAARFVRHDDKSPTIVQLCGLYWVVACAILSLEGISEAKNERKEASI